MFPGFINQCRCFKFGIDLSRLSFLIDNKPVNALSHSAYPVSFHPNRLIMAKKSAMKLMSILAFPQCSFPLISRKNIE